MRVKVIKMYQTLNIHIAQYGLNKTSGFESFCSIFMVSYILELFSQVQYWLYDPQGPK